MNYNKLWILLKERIQDKNSWGKNMLLNEMTKLEIEEAKKESE